MKIELSTPSSRALIPLLIGALFIPAAAVMLPSIATAAEAVMPTVAVSGKREVSTATRLDEDPLRLPFSTAVVTRDEMDNSGARTLEEALRSVPGLQHGTQGNYYTRFETRGLRDTQDVLVLMDGVPLRLLQGNADVTLIASDLVERIEFVKGPASALYGRNAIGGVAQFFMRPEKESAVLTAGAGSFGRLDGSYRQRLDYDRGNVFVGVAYSRSDGFQDDTARSQPATVLGIDHAMTSDWTSGLQLYDTRVHAERGSIVPLKDGKPMYGISQRDNYAIPGVNIDGDYQSLAWKNEWRLGAGWTLNHLSSYARYDRSFQGGVTIVPGPAAVNKGYSETDTADRGVFHEFSATHRYTAQGWNNTLQIGLNLENSWQDQASPTFRNAPTYRGPNYDTPVSNVKNDPRGIRGPVIDSRFDQRVRSLYLQDRVEIGDFGVVAGLRHDSFEQTLRRSDTAVESSQDGSRTSPRFGADWVYARRGGSAHSTFVNRSEGFRPQAVALNTRNNVVAPDILRPERTRSTEFGFKGEGPEGRWLYQLSLFEAEKVDGQRAFRNGPDSFIFSNATSRTRGLESLLSGRLSRLWSGYAHYTRQDAELLDFQTYDNAGRPTQNYAGNRVRMSARNIAGLGLTFQQGAWTWTSSVNYVGSRYLRDNVVNPQKLPSYTLLNTALTYQVSGNLALQAGVNNLTDEYYIGDDMSAQEAGNAGAPRSFFVRARLSL